MIARPARYALGLLPVCLLLSCGDEGTTGGAGETPDDGNNGLRSELVRSIADRVLMPALATFVTQAQSLEAAAQAWQAQPADEAARAAAQEAWRNAMGAWQRVEVMQFGPAGLMASVAGGEDLRDEIYSWPLVNRCRVDQETLLEAHADGALLSAEAINVRGLDALEYLLFVPNADNACAPNSAINTDGSWAALSEADVWQRRATYAVTAASLVVQSATELQQMWAPEGGNFYGEFVNAGQGSTTYATVQDALQAVSDAMFYAEEETKDMKLAEPAGLQNCDAATCPDELEHPFAQFSGESALINVQAWAELYRGAPEGADGTGFDDLLTAVGSEDLVTSIDERLAAALASLEPLQGAMETELASNPATIVAAHDATKALFDLFKTQFISVLDLDLPARAEGDND